jgi:hypothetical protein
MVPVRAPWLRFRCVTLAVSEFVNADRIAQGLYAFNPESVAIQAGGLMLSRLDELARQCATFVFETTLASRSFAPWLRVDVPKATTSILCFCGCPTLKKRSGASLSASRELATMCHQLSYVDAMQSAYGIFFGSINSPGISPGHGLSTGVIILSRYQDAASQRAISAQVQPVHRARWPTGRQRPARQFARRSVLSGAHSLDRSAPPVGAVASCRSLPASGLGSRGGSASWPAGRRQLAGAGWPAKRGCSLISC